MCWLIVNRIVYEGTICLLTMILSGLDIGITDKAAKDVPNANAISSPTSSTEALTEHGAGDPGPSRSES